MTEPTNCKRTFVKPGTPLNQALVSALAKNSGLSIALLQPWLEWLRDDVCPEFAPRPTRKQMRAEALKLRDSSKFDDAALIERMAGLQSDFELRLVRAAHECLLRDDEAYPLRDALYARLGILPDRRFPPADAAFVRQALAQMLVGLRRDYWHADRAMVPIVNACDQFWRKHRGEPARTQGRTEDKQPYIEFVFAVAQILIQGPVPQDVGREIRRILGPANRKRQGLGAPQQR